MDHQDCHHPQNMNVLFLFGFAAGIVYEVLSLSGIGHIEQAVPIAFVYTALAFLACYSQSERIQGAGMFLLTTSAINFFISMNCPQYLDMFKRLDAMLCLLVNLLASWHVAEMMWSNGLDANLVGTLGKTEKARC